jgi:hypothetical protein
MTLAPAPLTLNAQGFNKILNDEGALTAMNLFQLRSDPYMYGQATCHLLGCSSTMRVHRFHQANHRPADAAQSTLAVADGDRASARSGIGVSVVR